MPRGVIRISSRNRAVLQLRVTFAGLSCALPCFLVLDERNGRPAIQFSINSLPTESDSCDFGILPNFAAGPPDRPYKANVGGSIPSAPTKINYLPDITGAAGMGVVVEYAGWLIQ